jgi:methylated-DNA-protein-cysteine methyltransferase-like protein
VSRPSLPSGWEGYYRIVRRIPRGRVATYGEVALWAGKPRGARQVGFALAALRGTRHDVPWQRVLGARPRDHAAITILDPVGAAVQRRLLEDEGVRFDERDRIDLRRYGWRRRRHRTARGSPRRRGGLGAGRSERPTRWRRA